MTLVRPSHILALATAALLPAACADVPLDESGPYDDELDVEAEAGHFALTKPVEASCSGQCGRSFAAPAQDDAPCLWSGAAPSPEGAQARIVLPCPPPPPPIPPRKALSEAELKPDNSPCFTDGALPCPPPED